MFGFDGIMEKAKDVSIGSTIFEDEHDIWSALMFVAYFVFAPCRATDDLITWWSKWKKRKK